MHFCPYCGKMLAQKEISGRERGHCAECHFINFGGYVLGVGGIILNTQDNGEREILLIQRNHNPGKGGWYIPGGYVEFDELAHQGVVREIEEETGLITEVVGLVSYRNRIEFERNDSYAIFLLTVTGGKLIDTSTDEVAQIGYFNEQALIDLTPVSETSRLLATLALHGELQTLKPTPMPDITYQDLPVYLYL